VIPAAQFLTTMTGAVALITVPGTDGAPVASTVTTVASYSLDPPSVLVSTPTHLPIRDHFGVSALTTEQRHLAAAGWGRTMEFEATAELDGLPVATGSLVNLACRVAFRHAIGDRNLLIGDVTGIEFGNGAPLVGPGGPFITDTEVKT
jgi:flavin reductase (DIM6/NTAB) family NADH-FMN oxidoreductase RutF